ncbi:MAG TPA: hypothetical protein VK702_09910 [Candidatus Acidoferrum sp.]|jgi:hypothetical protein|nr:hypothetical protein [Candidatus Acidoferrum sp.]
MQIGTPEHKELFCRSFIDTHEVYEPRELPWPELDEASLAILRSIPVWSMALQVEVNAGATLESFAQSQTDPLIVQTLRLQGYEEDRHGRMLATLVERYGLEGEAGPPEAYGGRQAFIDFGYNECLDSFAGFGIFRIARQVRFLPDSLISLFARVMYEEARHIVFFVNWITYERCIRGYGAPPLQVLPTAIGYLRALKKTVGRAGATNTSDKGMAAAGEIFTGLTLQTFIQACLEENSVYMASFDPRLLRPRVVPTLARFVLGAANAVDQIRATVRSFARA